MVETKVAYKVETGMGVSLNGLEAVRGTCTAHALFSRVAQEHVPVDSSVQVFTLLALVLIYSMKIFGNKF